MHLVERAIVLVRGKLRDELSKFLSKLTAREIANILSRVEEDYRLEIFAHVSREKKARVLLVLDERVRKAMLERLSDKEIAEIIEKLASDDACRILRCVPEERIDFVVGYLPKSMRDSLLHQLRYSKEVAGGIMQKEVIVAKENENARDVLKRIADAEKRTWKYDVYVVDDDHRLIGRVPIEKLLKARRNARISSLSEDVVAHVNVMEDREAVVKIFKEKKIYALPVVDRGKLAGVITIDEALHIMEEEHTEDIFKMFSLQKEERVFDPLKKSIRSRTPWLMINLATAFLAASVVGIFEDVLKSFVLFAIFMPIVAGEGGNATTQTMAVIVRSLALKEISAADFFRVLKKEVSLAIFNGLIVGCVAAVLALIWKSSVLVAVALFLAMMINLLVAAIAGAAIPIIFDRLGSDPASSSTVILTTFTDVFGFMSFLGIGSLLLRLVG